jgi:hypothetical protein
MLPRIQMRSGQAQTESPRSRQQFCCVPCPRRAFKDDSAMATWPNIAAAIKNAD